MLGLADISPTEIIGGILLALLSADRVRQYVIVRKNGKNAGGEIVSSERFRSHCELVERMFKDDPPRRQTELLTALNTKIINLTEVTREVAKHTEATARDLKIMCDRLKS